MIDNNELIEKARQQYSICMTPQRHEEHYEMFKKAIEDNFPKSISREEVEKLREKRGNHTNRDVESRGHNIEEIIRDLDQLLSPTNQQDDTN